MVLLHKLSPTNDELRRRLTAPRDRNKRVRVIAVVISCAFLPNWVWRLVTLRETLKKSIASQVHANHLYRKRERKINLWKRGCLNGFTYPAKNCAH